MTITPPDFAGCPWPLAPGCLTDEWNELEEAAQTLGLAYASATLSRLTAYRVGNCPIKLRPCAGDRSAHRVGPYFGAGGPGWGPLNLGGVWSNGCGCAGGCSCSEVCQIKLPPPVGRLDEVRIDGEIMDLTAFTLYNGNVLAYTAGLECPFNLKQDLNLPDTEPGTFSVTYLNAYPVDLLGANAVTILAIEFAKACADEACQLPPNVTSLVRQGVSMQLAVGSFPGGVTGLKQVDTFIARWNPNHRAQQGMVYSPDMPKHYVESALTAGTVPDGWDGGGP